MQITHTFIKAMFPQLTKKRQSPLPSKHSPNLSLKDSSRRDILEERKKQSIENSKLYRIYTNGLHPTEK
jgi:hypothetical protein